MFYYLMANADWLLVLLVVLAPVFLFVGLFYLFTLCVKPKKQDEVTKAHYAHIIGILYAVLLGFITLFTLSSWESFNNCLRVSNSEINSIADLYQISNNLNNDLSIKHEILEYASLMVNDEWSKMQDGEESLQANKVANTIGNLIDTYEPQTKAEANLQIHALELYQSFMDARRFRLNKNQEGLDPLLSLIIGAGTFLTFCASFFLFAQRKAMQFVFIGFIAIMIGMQFALIYEFSYPYRGTISITSKNWSTFISRVQPIPQ